MLDYVAGRGPRWHFIFWGGIRRRGFRACYCGGLEAAWDSEDGSDSREHQPPIDKSILTLVRRCARSGNPDGSRRGRIISEFFGRFRRYPHAVESFAGPPNTSAHRK
ncbi:hypothetical protein VTO73DRAFT_4790 [Trametes versicolor]